MVVDVLDVLLTHSCFVKLAAGLIPHADGTSRFWAIDLHSLKPELSFWWWGLMNCCCQLDHQGVERVAGLVHRHL